MDGDMKKEELFLNDIRGIIDAARAHAVRSVDFCRVQMYWQLDAAFLRRSNKEKRGPTMAVT